MAVAQREFPQIYPKPGWVEHDPATIWKTQLSTAKRALRLAKLRELRVDGGASANNLLMHFQGDLLNAPRDPPLQHRDHRLGRGVPRRTGHGNLEEQK